MLDLRFGQDVAQLNVPGGIAVAEAVAYRVAKDPTHEVVHPPGDVVRASPFEQANYFE
jgi:hypothetical protein